MTVSAQSDAAQLLDGTAELDLLALGERAEATLTAVVEAAIVRSDVSSWTAAWAILAAAVRQNRPEIAAAPALLLARNRPAAIRRSVTAEYVHPTRTWVAPAGLFVSMLRAAGLMDTSSCLGTPTCHGQTPAEHVPACPLHDDAARTAERSDS